MRVFADPKIEVQLLNAARQPDDEGLQEKSVTPPPLNAEVFGAIHSLADKMWPGIPIIPQMETGATDSKYTMAAGTAEGSDGKRLGIVLEGVRRRLGTLIHHAQRAALFKQGEAGVRSGALYAARSDVPCDAEMADISFIAHALQLTDCDVVALI